MNRKTVIAALAAFFLAPAAFAGTVWVRAADDVTHEYRLLGIDVQSGQLVHDIDGEYIQAADVCRKTGTVYYLDSSTVKSVDADGSVAVVEDLGDAAMFSGTTRLLVGQRYCTIWVFAEYNRDIFIIRHAGTEDQQRIDTEAFDMIVASDIDHSNDDLWIGQANGRVYRVSKKTGLRSYRIVPAGAVEDIEVDDGIVHVMRSGGLTGYDNDTRRDDVEVVYTDQGYRDLLDDSALASWVFPYADGAGNPVFKVMTWPNFWSPPTFKVVSATINEEDGTLAWPGNYFIPFEDLVPSGRSASVGDIVTDEDGNFWLGNSDRLRLYHPSGAIHRDIDLDALAPTLRMYQVIY